MQFIRLALNDRARAVVRHGRLLATVEYDNYKCDLYSVADYFVEVKLTTFTSDVASIHIAYDFDLEKFINHIELPAF